MGRRVARVQSARRDGIFRENKDGCRHGTFGLERRPAGQALVENGAQGVHVGRRADLLAAAGEDLLHLRPDAFGIAADEDVRAFEVDAIR